MSLQRLDDLLRDLLLDVEDVVELALVGVAPQLAIGRDVDELHRDADRLVETAHAAADDVAGAELVADGPDVLLAPLELHRCPARDEFDLADQRQAGDQLLGEPVAEVIGFLVGADVVEGQHRECALLDQWVGTLRNSRGCGDGPRVVGGCARLVMLRRRGDRDTDPLERPQDRPQVRVRVALEVLDVLDAGERIPEAGRNLRRLEVHGQDVTLALAGQHDFLGDVVRADGRLGDHQQQHLGVLERLDDLLAPQRGAVDAALVDPERHARAAELGREVEDAILVLAGVADEDVGRLCQGGIHPGAAQRREPSRLAHRRRPEKARLPGLAPIPLGLVATTLAAQVRIDHRAARTVRPAERGSDAGSFVHEAGGPDGAQGCRPARGRGLR